MREDRVTQKKVIVVWLMLTSYASIAGSLHSKASNKRSIIRSGKRWP